MVQAIAGLLTLGIVVFIIGMQASHEAASPSSGHSPQKRDKELPTALDNNQENPSAMSMSGGTGPQK